MILVTGGLGYIGSHTVVELMESGHDVIVVDNLVNSKIQVLDRIESITGKKPIFYRVDLTEEDRVVDVFASHEIDGVIHFAGLKAVGESVAKPLDYYYNNLVSTIILSKMCIRYKVNKFVFSSSAAVYGDRPSPLREEMELGETTNPYGETKAINERILRDLAKANDTFSVTLLRYFNPVGAHKSGLIGEDPNGVPNNLLPLIIRVARGFEEKLSVFGDDYDTPDGTGIRDYIHVVDIARGHVKALENTRSGVKTYNLGTGVGTSVLQLVNAFERVNGVKVAYEVVKRREGDVACSFADPSKAEEELDWKAELTLEEMLEDVWRFCEMEE